MHKLRASRRAWGLPGLISIGRYVCIAPRSKGWFMSEFRVTWQESETGAKRTRKFDVAAEARGFIKGLRAHPGMEAISVRTLDETGKAVRISVPQLFEAAGATNA
jgi:hypothetical protein